MIRALDCRYVGQGYELRVTLDDGPFTEAALERVPPRCTSASTAAPTATRSRSSTRASRAIGKRPTLHELPVESGTFERGARRRERGPLPRRRAAAGADDALLRPRPLPLDEAFDGPAVVFHLDTTTVVPPGWRARADRSGNLLLTQGGAR